MRSAMILAETLRDSTGPSRLLDLELYRHLYPRRWAMLDPGSADGLRGSSWGEWKGFPENGWPHFERFKEGPWVEAADYHGIPAYSFSLDETFALVEKFERPVRELLIDRGLGAAVASVEVGPWAPHAPQKVRATMATPTLAILRAFADSNPTPSADLYGGLHSGPKDR